MKPLYFLLLLLLLIVPVNINSQELLTFGPVKETVSFPDNNNDDVGINCCPAVQYRVIKKWVWTYNELPNEIIVKSVRLRFYAAKYVNAPSHFTFNIHNFLENVVDPEWPYTSLFQAYPQIILQGTTITYNGHEYFDVTADENSNLNLFNAVKNAINDEKYYLCLGFKYPNETGANGWYQFRPYENFNDYNGPAIDLFVTYELPEYSITFYNNIANNLNYGQLILDEDEAHPLASGTTKVFELLENVDIRTNELPFILNYQGTTQKHKFWDLVSTSNYSLHNEFQVTSSTPLSQKSTFDGTSPVSIKNDLENTGVTGGYLNFKDPFYYYDDANNNWFQSDEFKNYSSPLNIQNNSINSYGGVFLNQPYTGNNPVYYSVQAINSQPIYIENVGTRNFYFQLECISCK